MTKMRKRILGLGCAAVFALSQIPLVLQAGPLGVSADAATNVTLKTYDGDKTLTVELEDGKLPDLPTPVREGYDFVGWFTAPVEVEFWGDDASETWGKLKSTYGTDYKYLNGRSIEWYNAGETPDSHYKSNPSYDWANAHWIEHSLGVQNATKGDWVKKGDMVPAGSTLYAMYDPKNITVYWYSNGWKGIDDTEYASTGRSTGFEYGGKFARLPLDEWAKWGKDGDHTFEGWMDKDGKEVEFDTIEYAQGCYGGMLKEAYTPATYEPVLRLYAIYDDVTTVGGYIKPAEFKGLIGGGRTFDPNLGSHTFTATFDSKNKQLPDNMGWELTSGTEHFDLKFSKDKTVATVTVKDAFKNHLPEAETVEVKFTFGDKTYTASATASHYYDYDKGRVVSGQWGACTAPYEVQYTCTACGQKKIVTTEAKGHEIVSREVPATCTEDAYTVNVCVKCGETTRTEKQNTALGHSWEVTTEKSCGGTVTTKTCTRCGETQVKTDETAQHTWESSPTVDVAPTCTTEGQQSVHCALCPAVKEQKTLPATGHSYSETKHEATCTEAGYTEKVCSACGDVQREAGEEAKGHTAGASVEVRKATCIQDGAKNTYCTECGALIESETLPLKSDAHDWSVWLTKTEDEFEITYHYCVLCGKSEEKERVSVTPAQQAEPEPTPEPEAEPVPEPTPEPVPEPAPELTPEPVPEVQEQVTQPEEQIVQPEVEAEPEVQEQVVQPEAQPEVQEQVVQPEAEPEVKAEPEVQEPAVKPEASAPKAQQAPSVSLGKLPEAAPEAPAAPAIVPERELAPKAPVAPEVSETETKTTPVPQTEEGNNAAVSGGATVEILPSMESAGPDSGVWMWITLACVCGAALVCVPMAVVAVKRRK